MATNSSSTVQGDVGCLEAYKNWMLNDKKRNNGQFTIPIKDLLPKFALILTISQYQTVYREGTDEEKIVKLFLEIMPANGEKGFKQVVGILFENNNIELANDLKEQMGNAFTCDITMSKENENVAFELTPLVDSRMMEAQEHMSTLIIDKVDCMAKFWSGLIHHPRIRDAFVRVQVLENYKDDSGTTVNEYHEVFENDSKIPFKEIVLQGDPGCGKSTYVNKIALEWAGGHEYLREKFHLVFLLVLQTFDVSIEEAIRALLPDGSVAFVEQYYKRHSSKVLLILDGFDEFPEDSQFYTEVMKMLNGGLSQFQFFTIVVTTRRSHVDKVPQRFQERSLLIKGFNEQSMKLFLQRQDVPVPDEQTDSNLVVLLQNPLFCTIYCSLHFGGVDKSKLKDPYDFIKALVDNAVKKEKKTKGAENEKQLKLLGAFAFQKLNSETLNVVDKMFSTFLSRIINVLKKKPDHAKRIDTDKIQLGLLIKKKIPVIGGGYQEEFDFPHQLVVEYLAARYFIRHTLMTSQRKQLQPEKLEDPKHSKMIRNLILSSPSSLPFIRFLLFEYVTSNFPDVESGRKLIFEFLSDEFSFICYFKANSETPTINDITSLNCQNIDSGILHDSRFYPTLAKCNQLKSLNFCFCQLSTNEASELVEMFEEYHLIKLTRLDLAGNSNVGSTPALFAALGKCKQLERLDLRDCDLSIESINRLITCIEDNCWVKLSQLDLIGNSNVGSTPALFTALGKCRQLEKLDLQSCSLSIESINRLTTCIDDNCWVKLSQLDLIGNSNVGSTPALFAALGKCKQLERLDLQQCSLSSESITPALFTTLGKCIHLETLNLRVCDLSIESINRLITCIDDNCWVKLSQLDLIGNSNVGSTPALFTALGKCKHLEKLDLQSCSLSIESINRLTTCIDDNCWVKFSQLDLAGNSNVGTTPALFAALGKCKQLETLDLRVCDLSIESINQLTTCIGDNCWVKLSQLNLTDNKNVGSTPALFAALGKCKHLEKLDLQSCSLSIGAINRLTTCIDDNCWVKLSQLDLRGNRNVGSTPALFAALGKCKQLEKLDLQSCSLSIGAINRLTTCIDQNCFVKLSQLDLRGNRNVGSTPALFAALGKCKQLQILDLQSCSLSIESINRITTCIDDNCWVKLSQLDLIGNINVGSTPALFAALGKCKQLDRLELQQCSLSIESITPALFATLGKCIHLETLDLRVCDLSIESINQLTTCIGDNCWVKLSQLNLTDNRNVGSTPALFTALGKCKHLEKLDLQSCSLLLEAINGLTTCIDDNCWVKLSQLDLRGNRNVGSTPALFAALGKCKHLEKLNLQSCSLSIEAINQLTTCIDDNCWVKLSQLDLRGNSNVGTTPALFAALGKCRQLETLDLRVCDLSIESINQLTTCIGDNCWVKLSQLNLTDNKNVGSTPALFAALGKCKHLEKLDLQSCSLLLEAINRFTTCIDDNCWVKLSQLDLTDNRNVGSTPALFAALGNCKQLEKLDLQSCSLSIEAINRLTTCIDDNCWVKLSQLDLAGNSNIGTTPALFAALGKCKQVETLDLRVCSLSIESINRITTCIDDNCWVKLSQLDLAGNSNVGSTPALFAALGKCKQLEKLDLQSCSLSIEAVNQLTTCIDDNYWPNLVEIYK